jgi:hypothetical protein
MAGRSEALFLAAGLALAAYGMWGTSTSTTPTDQAATTEPSPVSSVPVVADQPATEVVEVADVPPPPPAVEGLADAISRVLADRGHTELVPRSNLVEGLGESVVAVLIDHDVVLEVADDPAPEAGS